MPHTLPDDHDGKMHLAKLTRFGGHRFVLHCELCPHSFFGRGIVPFGGGHRDTHHGWICLLGDEHVLFAEL